jgi:hypothetical protein
LSDPVLSARAQKISRRAYWSDAGLNKGEASNSVRRAVFVPISKQDIQIIR